MDGPHCNMLERNINTFIKTLVPPHFFPQFTTLSFQSSPLKIADASGELLGLRTGRLPGTLVFHFFNGEILTRSFLFDCCGHICPCEGGEFGRVNSLIV